MGGLLLDLDIFDPSQGQEGGHILDLDLRDPVEVKIFASEADGWNWCHAVVQDVDTAGLFKVVFGVCAGVWCIGCSCPVMGCTFNGSGCNKNVHQWTSLSPCTLLTHPLTPQVGVRSSR